MRYVAEFRPVSGLVFRDARPFEAGTDTVGTNLAAFPPPPEAFWSALNRALAGASSRESQRTVKPRELRVLGFYLADQMGPLLPAMADVVAVRPAEDESAPETLSMLAPRSGDDARGELRPAWLSDREVRSRPCEDQFLRPEHFLAYLCGLRGLSGSEALVPAGKLIREELRTGVELAGRNVREGRLYTATVLLLDRTRDLHFRLVFEVRDRLPADLPREHIVRLGGEGKLAHLVIGEFDQANAGALPERARREVEQTVRTGSGGRPPFRVKLCLLTPAVFSARKELLHRPGTQTPAWRPFWMENSRGSWCRAIFDDQPYRVRLVAAAAPKAFALGPWDRRKHEPRPLHRCQPAGTVYFLELDAAEGASPDQALEGFFDDFWLRTLLVKVKPSRPELSRVKRTSDSVSPHGLRGFGWTAIGAWNYA